jgi:hypothetical protein
VSSASRAPGPRPLIGGAALIALIVGAVIVLLVLLPLSRGRLETAQSAAPSSLSLSYLELSLSQHPDDTALRKALVQKLQDSGQADKARTTLMPLLAPGRPKDLEAHKSLVALDRARFAALPESDAAGRQAALTQLLETARALEALSPPLSELDRLAQLYRELDQPLLAAQLIDRLARRGLPDTEARVSAADAAWLAAGVGENAAELHASLAQARGPNALSHARAAIERARAQGDARGTSTMIDRMRVLFPSDVGLLELAVQTAETYSVTRAYELATELMRVQPEAATSHRLVARLAEATGKSLRALDQYVWLVRHGGDDDDRARAIALAKANWDLPLVRELLNGQNAKAGQKAKTPAPASPRSGARRGKRVSAVRLGSDIGTRCQAAPTARPGTARALVRMRALRERVALDEALGDDRAALQKLTAALSVDELAQLPELWQQKLDLELTLGNTRAALATAEGMFARFGGGKTASERVANLQLALGDVAAALQTLQRARLIGGDEDEVWLSRLARLGFETGEVAAERAAYAKLTALPSAALWQYQRLYELAPDRKSALSVALAAFERFDAEHMLYAALAIYAAEGDEAQRSELLARAERTPGVAARPDYWQTRIGLHAQQASLAQQAASYARARTELRESERLLARAAQRGVLSDEIVRALRDSQSAQTLSLGLASGDAKLIERGFRARESRLSVRERVFVLQKLGQNDEALALARVGAGDASLSEVDRDVLLSDARALSAGVLRFVRVRGDALQMDGLATLGSTATLEYGGRSAGLRADVGFSQLQPRGVIDSESRHVLGSLQGRIARGALELGVHVRDERSLRPFGAFTLQLAGTPEAGAALRARVNNASLDTARLRALGVRDALEAELALPFAGSFYVSAKGSAEAYYTREARRFLGAGLNFDAGVGASVQLPASLGALGMRLAGRMAPRFTREAGSDPVLMQSWLPQSSEWAGVGASLGRGSLDVPPRIGRSFSYLLDGAAGWLWPLSGVGFSAQAGLGVSLLGEDLLTLAARGGNVVGSTAWSANLGYAVSIR